METLHQFTMKWPTVERAADLPPQPKTNAICERFIGSVRRECLDHILIISERQLYRLVKEYVEYFNHARPHQGIGSQIPEPRSSDIRDAQVGQILAMPLLGGLHHDYRRVA